MKKERHLPEMTPSACYILLVRGVRCEVTERAEPIRTGEKTYRGWYAVIGLNLFVAVILLLIQGKQSCFLRFYNIDPIDFIENRLPEHCNCKIVSHLQLVQIREKFRPRQSSVGRKHRMCSLSAYRETASFHMSFAIADRGQKQ